MAILLLIYSANVTTATTVWPESCEQRNEVRNKVTDVGGQNMAVVE